MATSAPDEATAFRLDHLIARFGNNGTARLLGVSASQPSRWRAGTERPGPENERRLITELFDGGIGDGRVLADENGAGMMGIDSPIDSITTASRTSGASQGVGSTSRGATGSDTDGRGGTAHSYHHRPVTRTRRYLTRTDRFGSQTGGVTVACQREGQSRCAGSLKSGTGRDSASSIVVASPLR